MDVVEIVVRFAGTLLQVAQLSHGTTFRIGTARDVDLALDVAPLTAFPLVGSTADGFVVRCPAGVPAVAYTADRTITIAETELVLAPGMRIDLAFGRVTISITRTASTRAPLPRPRPSFRPHVFAAVSLAMHVAVVAIAMVCAELDPITIPVFREPSRRPPVHLVRVLTDEQKQRVRAQVARKRARAAAAAFRTAVDEALRGGPRERAVHGARSHGWFGALTPHALRGLMGTKNLAKELADVGPIYDEHAARLKDFGGTPRWNVAGRGDFASVKTGRYATDPTSGADYDLGAARHRSVRVAMCETTACMVAGAIDRAAVRAELAQRMDEIVACYDRHAPQRTRGRVTLTFAIAADGTVDDVRGSGLASVAACVANVARAIRFPAGAAITQVKYPLVFSRG
jgi:hypothetical protein